MASLFHKGRVNSIEFTRRSMRRSVSGRAVFIARVTRIVRGRGYRF